MLEGNLLARRGGKTARGAEDAATLARVLRKDSNSAKEVRARVQGKLTWKATRERDSTSRKARRKAGREAKA